MVKQDVERNLSAAAVLPGRQLSCFRRIILQTFRALIAPADSTNAGQKE